MAFPLFSGSSKPAAQPKRPHRFAFDSSTVDPGMHMPLPDKRAQQGPPRRYLAYTIPLEDDEHGTHDTHPVSAAKYESCSTRRKWSNRDLPDKLPQQSTSTSSPSERLLRDSHILSVNSVKVLVEPDVGGATSGRGGLLFTGGRDGSSKVWNLDLPLARRGPHWRIAASDAASKAPSPHPAEPVLRHTSIHHVDWVNDVLPIDHGNTIVTASSDRTVCAWSPHLATSNDLNGDGRQRRKVTTLGHHNDYIKTLTYCAQLSAVASGGLDQRIKIWDVNETRPKPIIEFGNNGPRSSIYNLASTKDGNVLASASPEHVVRLWDPRAGRQITTLPGHRDHVRVVLISYDGEWVLSGSSDTTVKLWSVKNSRCLTTYTHHTASIWALCSSHPRLEVFYSASKDGWIAKTVQAGRVDGVVDTRLPASLCNSNDSDYGEPGLAESSLCIAIAKESSGVTALAAADDSYVWASTKDSVVHCWRDVNVNSVVLERVCSAHHPRIKSSEPCASSSGTTGRLKKLAGLAIRADKHKDRDNGVTTNALLDSLMSTCRLPPSSPSNHGQHLLPMLSQSKTFNVEALPSHAARKHWVSGREHRRTQSSEPFSHCPHDQPHHNNDNNHRRHHRHGWFNHCRSFSQEKSPSPKPIPIPIPAPPRTSSMQAKTRVRPRSTYFYYQPTDTVFSMNKPDVCESGDEQHIFHMSPLDSSTVEQADHAGIKRVQHCEHSTPYLSTVLSPTGLTQNLSPPTTAMTMIVPLPETRGHPPAIADVGATSTGFTNARRSSQVVPSLSPHPTKSNRARQSQSLVQRSDIRPIRTIPEWTMVGRTGIIRHHMLHNKRHVLTQDMSGQIAMWDLLECRCIRKLDKEKWGTNLDDVIAKVDIQESVPAWCVVDTKIGRLTVHLSPLTVWNAEVHVDELSPSLLDPRIARDVMSENERINIGQWMLKRFFEPYVTVRAGRGPLNRFRYEMLANMIKEKLEASDSDGASLAPSSSSEDSAESRPELISESRKNDRSIAAEPFDTDAVVTIANYPFSERCVAAVSAVTSELIMSPIHPLTPLTANKQSSILSIKAQEKASKTEPKLEGLDQGTSKLSSHTATNLLSPHLGPTTLVAKAITISTLTGNIDNGVGGSGNNSNTLPRGFVHKSCVSANTDDNESRDGGSGGRLRHSKSFGGSWISRFRFRTRSSRAKEDKKKKKGGDNSSAMEDEESEDPSKETSPRPQRQQPASFSTNGLRPPSHGVSGTTQQQGASQTSLGPHPNDEKRQESDTRLMDETVGNNGGDEGTSGDEATGPSSPNHRKPLDAMTVKSPKESDTMRTLALLCQPIPDKRVLYNSVFYPLSPVPPNVILYVLEESFDASCPLTTYVTCTGQLATTPPSLCPYSEVKDPVIGFELSAPSWLIDFLLHNRLPSSYVEPAKISFTLAPHAGTTLPAMPNSNARLIASRMLRARKLAAYVTEKLSVRCPPEHYVAAVEHCFHWYLKHRKGAAEVTRRLSTGDGKNCSDRCRLEQFFESLGEQLSDEERHGLRAYEEWKCWTLWKQTLAQNASRAAAAGMTTAPPTPFNSSNDANGDIRRDSDPSNSVEADRDTVRTPPPTSKTKGVQSQQENPTSAFEPMRTTTANGYGDSGNRDEVLARFLLPQLPVCSSGAAAAEAGNTQPQYSPPKLYQQRPEIWVELQCRNKTITSLTTLATMKSYMWKYSGDIQITYRWRPFVTSRVLLTSRMK